MTLDLPRVPSLMPARDFKALSLRDLLEAREAAHVHLSRKEGVVGTAIGRYLIRLNDPNSRDPYATYPGNKEDLGPRRLDNSIVTPWSWPCLLVFVRKWREAMDFRHDPQNFIAPSVDLPDGRQIPVCVVETLPDTLAAPPVELANQGLEYYCGGLPILSDVQGAERFGTVGCLVTDGRLVYALTAAHVAGVPDTVVRMSLRGDDTPIGTADACQIACKPFEEMYPTLPGRYVSSCLDAGLVRLNDVHNWSGMVQGVGRVGELLRIDMNTLSLSLIGVPVRAHGAGSGDIKGQILALFYRYQALGGYDYVADLLIGPRPGSPALSTRPGDSGAIFFYDHVQAAADDEALRARRREGSASDEGGDPEERAARAAKSVFDAYAAAEKEGNAPRWRPLAMQWGGQRFFGAPAAGRGDSFPFALATSLSTAFRALSVELVQGWDTSLPEYWGEVGHVTIGEVACDLVTGIDKLKNLFRNNRRNIGFDDAQISSGSVTGLGPGGFVPLADVPDDVWKKGGTGVKRSKDNPTHYADMDEPGANGKTLFELCLDPAEIRVATWKAHYEGIGVTPNHQGSLPFRVRQIFEAMVQAVEAGNVTEYVCAAGILAHYVGDSCQPLHGSRLADAHGVHSPYETTMITKNRGGNKGVVASIRTGIHGRLGAADVTDGADAARRTIELMRTIATILPPERIIDVWDEVSASSPVDYKMMWQKLGADTGRCMAEGALLLASLWQSAWKLGGGDQTINSDAEIDYKELRTLFEPNNPQFLPSLYLEEYPY